MATATRPMSLLKGDVGVHFLRGEHRRTKGGPTAHSILSRAFDPKLWRSKLVDRMLPVLAVGMARSMTAQFLELGVDIRRKKSMKGKKGDVRLFVKATSASKWLEDDPDDLEILEELVEASGIEGFGILTELPEALKERISDALKESFSQDYWDEISETTGGAAERVLEEGLTEGASIRDMAKDLKEALGGDDYAGVRATNIARTESKAACSAGRKDGMDQLQEDLGDKIPMRATWLSVLGPTTREAHAELDGVPADDDGLWDLNGVMVPYPAHYSLPAEDRCNCQCSLIMELGMDDDEAHGLIEDYYSRLEEAEEASVEGGASIGALRIKGGPNSGNFGHAGRPGRVGGSTPGDGSGGSDEPMTDASPATAMRRRPRVMVVAKPASKSIADAYRDYRDVPDDLDEAIVGARTMRDIQNIRMNKQILGRMKTSRYGEDTALELKAAKTVTVAEYQVKVLAEMGSFALATPRSISVENVRELRRPSFSRGGATGLYHRKGDTIRVAADKSNLHREEDRLTPGLFSATEGLRGIVRHEMGHCVWDNMWDNADSMHRRGSGVEREIIDGWKSWYNLNKSGSSASSPPATDRPQDNPDWPGHIGEYATSMPTEAFAEAFAVYTHPDYDRTNNGGMNGVKLPPTAHAIMKRVFSSRY